MVYSGFLVSIGLMLSYRAAVEVPRKSVTFLLLLRERNSSSIPVTIGSPAIQKVPLGHSLGLLLQ